MNDQKELRMKALELAVKHVESHDGSFVSGQRVLAFAEVFEKYIETGQVPS